ncbi:accessory gene regulator ArgB-like protein [Halalkalibacter urbisdiaboli]|uniref:accessory gene regulator ArgB-like protein n=1 Tax=Halalkalibacter urbisdiaboli TaxID=1960589 RepID=UPI000B443C5A|nr:accessory gene regulator B family protein [Halalkalibacter urbisdiaboli]
MIEQFATKAAHKIKNMNPEETAPLDVLIFGFTILLNLVVTLSLILVTSLLLGKMLLAVQITLAFMVLRILTGGAHLDQSFACSLNSVCLVIAFLWLPVSQPFMLGYAALTLLFIISYAPYYEPHQMKHSAKWERKKKRVALVFVVASVGLYYGLAFPGFLIGCFLQALLLTPVGISFTHRLNQLTTKGGELHEEGNG